MTDGLGQVSSFDRGTLNGGKTAISGSPSRTIDWDFDALGNFQGVDLNGTVTSRTHNAQNEVTAVGGNSLAFDPNGNMLTDETGRQFRYDAWNRLVQVLNSGGTLLKSYTYDGLGRRITETPNGGSTTDLYYSAGWQVIEERVAGATTARYVWSPVYVDALVLRDRDTDANGSLDERLYAVQDANFNVVALVNTSGTVVERYEYDPFGAVTVLDGSYGIRGSTSYVWVRYHQGLAFDSTSKLYDSRGRWYSPALHRFVSPDSLGYTAGDVNLYRYVGDNPVNFVDPAGHEKATVKTKNGTFSITFTGGIRWVNGRPLSAAEVQIEFTPSDPCMRCGKIDFIQVVRTLTRNGRPYRWSGGKDEPIGSKLFNDVMTGSDRDGVDAGWRVDFAPEVLAGKKRNDIYSYYKDYFPNPDPVMGGYPGDQYGRAKIPDMPDQSARMLDNPGSDVGTTGITRQEFETVAICRDGAGEILGSFTWSVDHQNFGPSKVTVNPNGEPKPSNNYYVALELFDKMRRNRPL